MVRTGTPPAKVRPRSFARADLVALSGAAALVGAAVVVALVLPVTGVSDVRVAAPLFARWLPHVGPGTPAALLVAAAVCWFGPALAARLPWRRLLLSAYLGSVAWTLALALVDGWQRGLAARLTTPHEYLSEVAGVTDVGALLRGFTARILDFQPDSWATHVAGHPPGALLVFVGLDRIGLGGGAWAALVCVLAGSAVAVAVPVTIRALGAADAARTAVPFLVLFPGAVWVGASADGLFAGVTAAGVAVLACAGGRAGRVLAVGAGVLLGFACYLSYGLVLMAPIALAVLVAARRLGQAVWVLAGTATVVAGFTLAGFWWLDGYHALVERYYQGIASDRPYAYWVWANLACLTLSAGPVLAPILRRSLGDTSRAITTERRLPPPWLLPTVAAAVAVLAADLSGMSKAEVERIWLPFAVWILAGAALLPRRHQRAWLVAQAVTALAVNHLLLTTW
ncbi:hypothetical protein SAMN05421812_11766 [Asanoa hainanensis]|uniref:Integral membrane protein n=1 Tax=Asanoa hainanensis TaxID=560556 RepID=A0A239PBJ6_9ACTN|nr:hypothetical protein [Asanoa hainanensis]SNT64506.1 hypothetical protein SAMN05421812_11766 [Asanoa hainanensis]